MSACTQKSKHNGHYIVLSDGHKMPVIALGTLAPSMLSEELLAKRGPTKSGEVPCQTLFNTVKEATKTALDIGYRHVDCAYSYMAEEAVGQAFRDKIAEGTVKREDLFYTTKLWGTFHRPDLVRIAVEKALAAFQLDYIDLFIIHHPVSLKHGEELFPMDENGAALFDYVDLRQTWEAMEECKDAGLVKSIGVSNFNCRQLELILKKPGLKYKPVCNQVECHPYLTQNKLLEFCKTNGIVIAAYGVLGSPTGGQWVEQNCPAILKDPVLISIGEKYKKTAAQVSIRYIIQRGCVAVVKSFNPDRMKQNLQVFDFSLSEEDMKAIDNRNLNVCYWKAAMWKNHPEYPLNNGD